MHLYVRISIIIRLNDDDDDEEMQNISIDSSSIDLIDDDRYQSISYLLFFYNITIIQSNQIKSNIID